MFVVSRSYRLMGRGAGVKAPLGGACGCVGIAEEGREERGEVGRRLGAIGGGVHVIRWGEISAGESHGVRGVGKETGARGGHSGCVVGLGGTGVGEGCVVLLGGRVHGGDGLESKEGGEGQQSDDSCVLEKYC
jgi:hypothetical protein